MVIDLVSRAGVSMAAQSEPLRKDPGATARDYRPRTHLGLLRRPLGEIFHDLAGQKESKSVEGPLRGDHVHLCLSIPPKYAVAPVVGYLKGKSAIQIARPFGARQRHFTGENFWARGYAVSMVGLDEHIVRAYLRTQEQEDERYDPMRFDAS